MPTVIADLVSQVRHAPQELADMKQQYFSYIDLAGNIGGIHRQIRLKLDENWINSYLDRMRRRKK